jgi:TorA maturation chaperone TorD
MDAALLAAAAPRRSALYWLLADIALTCPDRAFVERLQTQLSAPGDENSIALRLAQAGNALPRLDDAPGIEQLAVEYARLFGGLRAGYGLAPPFESLQDEAAEAASVAMGVARCYTDAGLEVTAPGVPADHLGSELRFMALLCHREMQARQAGDAKEAMRALVQQRDFIETHLGRWAPQRWALTAEAARHEFYRALAAMALELMLEDPALIEELAA